MCGAPAELILLGLPAAGSLRKGWSHNSTSLRQGRTRLPSLSKNEVVRRLKDSLVAKERRSSSVVELDLKVADVGGWWEAVMDLRIIGYG